MTERPANQDMIEGFKDGYDLDAPEPNANRSYSYRHGFMVGRIDKGKLPVRNAGELRDAAEVAMAMDDPIEIIDRRVTA